MSSIFRALNSRNYRLHFTGQSISLIGTWMQRVAVSWLVYRLTNSAYLLGLVTFLGLIPSLVLAPYIGSFVDRNNRYKIVLFMQIGMMIQAGFMALLVWFQWYNIFWIGFLSMTQGVLAAFETNARQSMMVDLVEKKEDLSNALALNSSAFNAARLIGPALAGIVLSTIGEDACFIINFLSFVAVIFCLVTMKINTTPLTKSTENIWVELKNGYSYLRSAPDLSSLILTLAISSLLVIPFTTLLPVLAKDIFHGNAVTFSWFESAGGLGAMIGAIYMASLKDHKYLTKITVAASSLLGLGLIFLAYSPALVFSLICVTLATMGMMMQTASINTYIQTHTLPNMRGRAISYYLMAYQGILPIGSLLTGIMAEKLGTRDVILMEGIAGILLISCFALYKNYYHWKRLFIVRIYRHN
ncbi:MFS transporter [Pedobacter sp. HMF7647]|uniref:MFS transporter n=1 Tax=Hufsiella arboris TaxID=2695275 RepID=A0A7K1YD88_9SPHI|nr:MFS transporter [Hufsiella arboris]MXV52380.1 MFS transporter [Hufsiella arboris]